MNVKNVKSLKKEDLDVQENLSLNKLKLLAPKKDIKLDTSNRPPSNFIDLMNWTVGLVEPLLKDNKNLQKLIHNRIIIDGEFLSFCEEKKASIECILKDSIVSWRNDSNYESFFAQGIFIIKFGDLEFVHSALFHKGNQNEDEVSFFVIVSNNNYEKYISFRNEFEDWIKVRDRENLTIKVFNGDEIPYVKEHSWDDLFLPEDLKNNIRNLIEIFLSSKDFYHSKKIPWKRGFLLHGEPGNGKTSIIRTIISNYDFKPLTILPEANNDMVRDAFAYAEEQSPALLYFEDLDSLFEKGLDKSTFLNLMDGVSAKNGILVIATANDIGKLKSNIINRPSRFDRKFEIPLPNSEMGYVYLKKWFGTAISSNELKLLVSKCIKNKFSYAHLKDLYISSMYEAISNNRKIPSKRDIENAMKALLQDKNILNSIIDTDKYFKGE